METTVMNLAMGASGAVTPEAVDAAIAAAVTAAPEKRLETRFTLEALIRSCPDDPGVRKMVAERIGKALSGDVRPDRKLLLCRQLWYLGPVHASPVLGPMLLDDQQAETACYAFARDPHPDAGQLLRDALGKAKGQAKLAIINLLGDRRDPRALNALGEIAAGKENASANAAVAALAKLGTPLAAQALAAITRCGNKACETEAAHALLVCAEGLLERGAVEAARAAYKQLAHEDAPSAVKKAAALGLQRVGKAGWTRIFDGKTFAGWEGNLDWFRIEDGAVVAGSLKKPIPNNEFLCTEKEYGDFELRLQVKLLGEGGNAGIQIRSQRIPNHHEVIGYQADMGQSYWGGLYDESRRKKMLTAPDPNVMAKVLHAGDWNEYTIRCRGKRIQLWINGFQTVDYTEADAAIPATGIIGLQIHGGQPSEAWYRGIVLRPLSGK